MKASDLLSLSGFSPIRSISPENFVDLCPALILQLDSHVCCGDGNPHRHDDHDGHDHSEEMDVPRWQSAAGMNYSNVVLLH